MGYNDIYWRMNLLVSIPRSKPNFSKDGLSRCSSRKFKPSTKRKKVWLWPGTAPNFDTMKLWIPLRLMQLLTKTLTSAWPMGSTDHGGDVKQCRGVPCSKSAGQFELVWKSHQWVPEDLLFSTRPPNVETRPWSHSQGPGHQGPSAPVSQHFSAGHMVGSSAAKR